ncbi:hypothetical protein SmJEL517_g06048 [Synchytrium microbalum]|uniref:Phorbol-ester/DAG-type domain-containing protein n=1 Tax=Synchytrium microbalum TaxID=1806994 RepID=A0A507BHN0_9FUNG|nr:uncharacterized protein SmJEL517_g06048 [Synchytrium microbalum]TPX30360.1 hypothetical protein SmJEL517_g06048 [Synchytrium microbalum]
MTSDQHQEDHHLKVRVAEVKNVNLNGLEAYCTVGLRHKSDDGSIAVLATTDSKLEKSRPSLNLRISRTGSSMVLNSKSTPTLNRTRPVAGASPLWTEEFDFDLDDGFDAMIITVYKKTLVKDTIVGTLIIPVDLLEPDSKSQESWYSLSNRYAEQLDIKSTKSPHSFEPLESTLPTVCAECRGLLWSVGVLGDSGRVRCENCHTTAHSKCSSKLPADCGQVGSIRVLYTYTREPICPRSEYDTMTNILLAEDLQALSIFGRVCEEREDVAKHLLTLLDSRGLARNVICKLCQFEIQATKDPNTIFRGNSLATKSLDVYMKRVGMKYLQDILQPIVKEIIKQNRSTELDPLKRENQNSEAQDEAQTVLIAYVQWTLRSILSSSKKCPKGMKTIFRTIRSEIVKTFPTDKASPSSILSPKLFDLTDTLPNSTNARTFALISKCCQQSANFVPFDGRKEAFMQCCNDVVSSHFQEVRKFCDELCEPETRKTRRLGGSGTSSAMFSCCTNDEDNNGPKSPVTKASEVLSTAEFDNTNKQGEVAKSLAALSRHISRVQEKMMASVKSPEEREASTKLLAAVSTLVKSNYAMERRRLTNEMLVKRRTNYVFAEEAPQETSATVTDPHIPTASSANLESTPESNVPR